MANIHQFLPQPFPLRTIPSTPHSKTVTTKLWNKTMDDSDEYVNNY